MLFQEAEKVGSLLAAWLRPTSDSPLAQVSKLPRLIGVWDGSPLISHAGEPFCLDKIFAQPASMTGEGMSDSLAWGAEQ